MTEALVYGHNDQHAVPYQAAISFEAGGSLREIIRGTVNEAGRRAIGERALTLSSDPLVFANEERFDDFNDATLAPFLRQKIGASRVPVLSEASLEKVYTRGESVRMTFTPAEEARIALAGIYGRMAEQLRGDNSRLASLVRERKRDTPGLLALSLPAEFFANIPLSANRADMNIRMLTERRQHGVLFVHRPTLRSSPMR